MTVLKDFSIIRIEDEYKVFGVHKPSDVERKVPEDVLLTRVSVVLSGAIPQELFSNRSLIERVRQIQKAEIPTLVPGQIWNIAQTLEVAKRRLGMNIGYVYLFRRWPVFIESKLFKNESVIVDTVKQLFFVLLSKSSNIFIDGAYKKIRLALVVPFCSFGKTDLVVRLSNITFKNSDGVIDSRLTNHWFHAFRKELKIRESYLCTQKPIEIFAQRPSYYETGRLYVLEKPLKNLENFPKNASEKELLECALSLLSGLLEFHSDGRIHGDIKRSNVLWLIEREKVVCKWIDFGFSQSFNEATEKEGPFLCYWYGSVACTPPELLGRKLTGLEELVAVEAWALGFLFYSLVFEYPSWGEALLTAFGEKQVDFNKLHEFVVKEIEVSFKLLRLQVETGPLPLRKAFSRMCCGLLNVDPKARWTLLQAKEYLEKCLPLVSDCSEIHGKSVSRERSSSI